MKSYLVFPKNRQVLARFGLGEGAGAWLYFNRDGTGPGLGLGESASACLYIDGDRASPGPSLEKVQKHASMGKGHALTSTDVERRPATSHVEKVLDRCHVGDEMMIVWS